MATNGNKRRIDEENFQELNQYLNENEEFRERDFNGAFIAMKKKLFAGHKTSMLPTYIIGEKGTAPLKLVSPGKILPQLAVRTEFKEDYQTRPAARLLEQVIVIAGGDAINNCSKIPKFFNDSFFDTLIKTLKNQELNQDQIESCFSMASYMEFDFDDLSDKIFAEYFPFLENKNEYILYFCADCITMSSLGQYSFMDDINVFNKQSFQTYLNDKIYVGERTYEIDVEIAFEGEKNSDDNVGFVRPVYHGSNTMYTVRTINPPFSECKKSEISIFKKFNQTFTNFLQLSEKKEEIITTSWFSSMAASIVFNNFPTPFPIKVSQNTLGDKHYFLARLELIKKIGCYDQKPFSGWKIVYDELHGSYVSLLSFYQESVISPGALLNYRQGLKKCPNLSIWLLPVDLEKMQTLKNFKKEQFDSTEDKEELCYRLDAGLKLTALFDDKNILNSEKLITMKEIAEKEGESIKNIMAINLGVKSEDSVLRQHIKNPHHRYLCVMNGNLGMFIEEYIRNCLFICKHLIYKEDLISVFHPYNGETFCTFCQIPYNNKKGNADKVFCLCYLLIQTMSILTNKKIKSKIVAEQLWKNFCGVFTPLELSTEKQSYAVNASVRVLENSNHGFFGTLSLQKEDDPRGFIPLDKFKKDTVYPNYQKNLKMSKMLNKLEEKIETMLGEDQYVDISSLSDNGQESYYKTRKLLYNRTTRVIKESSLGDNNKTGSYMIDGFKAIKSFLLTDKHSTEDREIPYFLKGHKSLIIKGNKTNEKNNRDDDDDFCTEWGESDKKYLKIDYSAENACVAMILYIVDNHEKDLIFDFDSISEPYKKYFINPAPGDKSDFLKAMYRICTPIKSKETLSIGEGIIQNYFSNLALSCKRVYEESKKLLHLSNEENFEHVVHRQLSQISSVNEKSQIKRSFNSYIDTPTVSSSNLIQFQIESKLLCMLTHHTQVRLNASSGKSSADTILSNEKGPECKTVNIEAHYQFPEIQEGSLSFGLKKYTGGERLIPSLNNKLIPVNSFRFKSPLQISAKMDMFGGEGKEIDDEKYTNTKIKTNELEEKVNEVYEKTDSFNPHRLFTPFPLMKRDVNPDILVDKVEHRAIIGARLKSQQIKFGEIDQPYFADDPHELAGKYVTNYFNKLIGPNSTPPSFIKLILRDIGHLTNAIFRINGCLKTLIKSYEAYQSFKKFDSLFLTKTNMESMFLQLIFSKNKQIANIALLFAALAELYSYTIPISLPNFNQEYERDVMFRYITLCGIFNIIPNPHGYSPVSKIPKVRHLPLRSQMMVFNEATLESGNLEPVFTLDTPPIKRDSTISCKVGLSSYKPCSGGESMPVFTRFKFSGLPLKKSFLQETTRLCTDNKTFVLMKTSLNKLNGSKNTLINCDIEDMVDRRMFEDLLLAKEEYGEGFVKKITDHVLNLLNYPPGTTDESILNLSKEEFIKRIVEIVFPEKNNPVDIDMLKNKFFSIFIDKIFITENDDITFGGEIDFMDVF